MWIFKRQYEHVTVIRRDGCFLNQLVVPIEEVNQEPTTDDVWKSLSEYKKNRNASNMLRYVAVFFMYGSAQYDIDADLMFCENDTPFNGLLKYRGYEPTDIFAEDLHTRVASICYKDKDGNVVVSGDYHVISMSKNIDYVKRFGLPDLYDVLKNTIQEQNNDESIQEEIIEYLYPDYYEGESFHINKDAFASFKGWLKTSRRTKTVGSVLEKRLNMLSNYIFSGDFLSECDYDPSYAVDDVPHVHINEMISMLNDQIGQDSFHNAFNILRKIYLQVASDNEAEFINGVYLTNDEARRIIEHKGGIVDPSITSSILKSVAEFENNFILSSTRKSREPVSTDIESPVSTITEYEFTVLSRNEDIIVLKENNTDSVHMIPAALDTEFCIPEPANQSDHVLIPWAAIVLVAHYKHVLLVSGTYTIDKDYIIGVLENETRVFDAFVSRGFEMKAMSLQTLSNNNRV